MRVTDIDMGRRRIGLSLKALTADPWDDAVKRYQPGQAVSGRVESVQAFGVFVEVEPGVTALLPASESNTQGQAIEAAFRVGDTVEAKVLRVDADDRKMALTRREEGDRSSGGDRGGRGGFGGGRGGGGGGGGRGPRRDDRGPRPSGGGGRGPRTTLAYSDDDKDDKGVGDLGAALLAALNKSKD